MQLKKITTFTLLAVVLIICSLSTISAADQTINDTSTGGILQGISDTGTGDTLYLNPGTYNKTNQDTNITINKNITIQGNGSKNTVIIDARGLSRIFTIDKLNVTLINITFLNGASQTGGAILASDYCNLKFINCYFNNNSATTSIGGSLRAEDSNVTIDRCIFENSYAGNNGGAISIGGSGTNNVYVTGNYLIISNSTFNNNSALNGPSAVHLYRGINASILDSNFTNNSASYATLSTIYGFYALISGCRFIDNSGGFYGGAIRSISGLGYDECYVEILSNTFINNSADIGGAIFNGFGSSMNLLDNSMVGNFAFLGQMIYNNGTIGILNLTYLNNSTLAVLNGSTITIYATLTDDMGNTITGQEISFYVDGIFIANVTSIEGQANSTYLVNKTPVAILPVTGEYSGHEGYSIIINNGQLEIIKRNIIVNITIEENPDGSITVIANATYEDDGTPVIDHPVDFILNDEIVGTGITDENGIAKITIPANKIKNGTNNITVIVKGDENSNNGTTSTIYIRTSDPDPVDPIDPIGPIDPVDPNNPNEPSEDEKTSNNPAVKTSAAMKETGIPINLILLVLLSCLGIVIRKTRK